MRIVQTPIIKSKQKQETTPEIQKQNTEGEELDFVIHTGNNEERQKIEEGNSTQVLPAQINGNSNTKDLINKQTDNSKTEDIATENMHHNKKSLNESKTTTRKEESNCKATTSKYVIGKGKDRQRTARRNKIYREWGKDTSKQCTYTNSKKCKRKYEKRKHGTSTNIRNNR